MSGRGILVALATVGLLILPACIPKPSTKLEIEITGGFAYVPTPSKKMLEVAYLNDVEWKEADGSPSCSVKQIGTELVVVRGDITDAQPPAPEDGIFDLNGWVVTFPALDKANMKFDGFRKSGMPSPKVVGPTGSWKSQKYVPSTKDNHPDLKVKKDWQDSVNGWVVLKGGKIVGSVPTDPLMQHATFDYQFTGTSTKASLTDKMTYTVDVPGDNIEVVFTNKKTKETKRIVLNAPDKAKPVRLILRGLHSMPMTPALGSRIELTDFCAFYSLLDGGEAIPKNQRLRLFYEPPSLEQMASYAPPTGPPPQPSPGFYCGGDWP